MMAKGTTLDMKNDEEAERSLGYRAEEAKRSLGYRACCVFLLGVDFYWSSAKGISQSLKRSTS